MTEGLKDIRRTRLLVAIGVAIGIVRGGHRRVSHVGVRGAIEVAVGVGRDGHHRVSLVAVDGGGDIRIP